MFKLKNAFFGERSVTKVAGLFPSRTEAARAADELIQASILTESQVRILGPTDGDLAHETIFSRAVEPEQKGIWRSLIRSHVTLGIAGVVTGALLFAAFILAGNQAVRSTPGIGFVAFTGFGLLFGLMAGGAVSLRPDHGRLVAQVRSALSEGRWALVAHPTNADQTHQVVAALEAECEHVVRSL